MKIKSVSFRLPELLVHRLSAQARKENLTPDQLVLKIVETYLASENAKGTEVSDLHAHRHDLPGIMEKLKKAREQGGTTKKGGSTPPS